MDTSAKRALERLLEGNKRYADMKSVHPNQGKQRREEVTGGQRPFAVILGCSDSRVPPEILFDTGIGDIFIVRVAGNITSPVVVGSIEYAVEHLHVPLVVVLGHTKCGAVQAAIKGGAAEGQIAALVEAITPAVQEARSRGGDLFENAVKANVHRNVESLRTSQPILGELAAAGKLTVVGAVYDLENGGVQIIGQ